MENKKKIVFIFNAIITRCVKRVEEFIDNGYEVEVYAFDRGGKPYVEPTNFEIKIIGKHDVSMNYIERMKIIYKSLKKLFIQYKNQDVLYYYFFFDVAFVACLLSNKSYIYEESDMPYTNIKNNLLRNILAVYDRKIIKQSLLTIMTSEGFINYHFGDKRPSNILIVPNRVNIKLENCERSISNVDINHLRFAFVGGFRYKSVYNFVKTVVENFPQHQFHIYGNLMEYKDECQQLELQYSNFYLHGKFKNPEDLKSIYDNIDLVLATYDANSINAQYAEPNKLYESIFFCTPIIVSKGTFLSKKVERLGIGYSVDVMNFDEIINFIQYINYEDIKCKQEHCKLISKNDILNKNLHIFKYLLQKYNL